MSEIKTTASGRSWNDFLQTKYGEAKEGQHSLDFDSTGRANRRRRIFLDTETTGMSSSADRIVEIAAIEIDENFETVDTFHAYINPRRKVPCFVTKIHGLDNRFLDDKPTFAEIGQDFLSFVEGADLYAHNMSFDSSQINAELKRNFLPSLRDYGCSLYCTLLMARRLFPGQRNSLDALLDRFEIDRTCRKIHGALLDTRLLIDVYRNLKETADRREALNS